jgi:hypothetical protein
MASKRDDGDEVGCFLLAAGFILTGLALGWRFAFGFLGIAFILLAVLALSRK